MHFESTDSSAVVCELQSELVAQAVASLSTGFSAADGCTFFSKTTHNVPKSLLLLPCFGSVIVVEPIGGDGFSCGSPPKSSNLTSPPPLVAAVVVVVIVVVVVAAAVVVIVVVVVVVFAAVVAGYNV